MSIPGFELRTDKPITFVVFDMEWNQPFPGKDYFFDTAKLTGEIIEIGAVKYTVDGHSMVNRGEFSSIIKPRYYTKLHYHIKKLTHKTDLDLRKGDRFEEAYSDFREFIGEDAILVGWGTSDPDMLKMNLSFMRMDDKLSIPFLDLQPVFSKFTGEVGKQRSVEYAVDYYGIDKKETFHSALADAIYTGEILEQIFEHNKKSEVLSHIATSVIDPDMVRDFSFMGPPVKDPKDAYKFVSEITETCPACDSALKNKVDSFRIRKSVYGLYECPVHGDFYMRIRVKKNRDGDFFAASVIRFATQNDYFLIAKKIEEYKKYGENGAPIVKNIPEDTEKEQKDE